MKKIQRLFLILILFAPATLWAQEPWTLEKCIEHALQYNLQVKQQELNAKISESSLEQSKLNQLPSLNISGNHAYGFGRVTNYITNQKETENTQSTSVSISSEVSLFQGFQLINTKKKNAYDLQASLLDVETVKNSVALSVASAYLQILYQTELVDVAEKQISLSKMQVDRAKVMVDAGSIPEGNLLDMESLLASDEVELINSKNQLDIAYLDLIQLLEIKSPEGFSIVKPNAPESDSTSLLVNPKDIYGTAEVQMPQILSLQLGVRSAETKLKIAKGNYYPTLSLYGNYSTGAQRYINTSNPLLTSDPFFTQIKNNASKTIALSLSIPIFNGGSNRYQVSTAKILLDNAQFKLDAEKNSLYKSIQQAYIDAVGAQKKLKASQKNKISTEESFRYTENKYNLGLVNALDYTTAKNKLAKAETDLLQAKYEYIFKLKILDFYKGVPLKL